MVSRVWFSLFVVLFSVIASPCLSSDGGESTEKEHVLTLDQSNFADTVAKHDFIVVEFYAPWCGHCKKLTPEFEKAASVLSSNDPPVILAKVDANEEQNKGLAGEYDIKGFPTLKIFRNGGKIVQDYKGPREAEGIIDYLKKQSGPASAEIKNAEDAKAVIDEKKIVVVGVFPEFSGEKFQNFMALADKFRSDYEFGHTLNAKLLPRGDTTVSGPTVRLFKPFDELVVDSQDFDLDTLEKFIEEASVPLVTLFNREPDNHPFVVKFFNSPNAKAMLFMNFSSELLDAFKSKYREVAEQFKGQGIIFLLGDIESSQGALQYFGLKEDQAPLIIVQTNDGQKYLKPHLEPDQISSWVKEFQDGNAVPFKKSEPIPETNDEPVKVVVADTFDDIVVNSGKDVLLEFYAPWCGHCKKLAPILDEIATSFKNDVGVVIAKIDATANDISSDTFDVQGYPTLYFRSASGVLSQYDGDRSKEAIIEFIQKNRHTTDQQDDGRAEL